MAQLRLFCQWLVLTSMALPVAAHEFWIDPEAYRIDPGSTLKADIRVGENFSGSAQSYFPERFSRFEVSNGSASADISGRLGDRPAASVSFSDPGLYGLLYQSGASTVTYGDFAKFEKFVKAHGEDWVIEAHRQKGYPNADFKEVYFRYAKSLVAVGEAKGKDAFRKMPFELVALSNPYTDDDPTEVQLLFLGKPVADHQIDVFRHSEAGEVTKASFTTDPQGKVQIPNEGGEVLVNAVKLTDPTDIAREQLGVIWQSLWASLTYGN